MPPHSNLAEPMFGRGSACKAMLEKKALGSHKLGNAGLIQVWYQRALSRYCAKVRCEFLGMRVRVQINFISNTFSTKHLRTSQ